MKINSAQLEAFTAVARHLNFTRAAESLNITQSALSQRIAKLEEELETTLIIRDRAAIRLTEAGEKVLRFCHVNDQAEDELLSSLKDSNQEMGGVLRIGAMSSVQRSLVIPALKKILQQNPRLSLQLCTREVREMAALLKTGEVDYILTNQKSEFGDIEHHLLGYEQYVLVENRKGPAPEIYLDHDEMDPTTQAYFSLSRKAFKPLQRRYLDDVYGLLEGVLNGFGKAVLPLHLIREEKNLVVVDPKTVLKVPVYLQYYRQPYYRKLHTLWVKTILAYVETELTAG